MKRPGSIASGAPASRVEGAARVPLKYAIVTPVHNEEAFISRTLESVASQTVLPVEWIVVNDRSSDRTFEIVARVAKVHPWVRLVEPEASGPSEYSARIAWLVMNAITKLQEEYDVLLKLDGDVSFGRGFCANVLAEFETDPALGIASGRLVQGAKTEHLRFGDNTRGATKFYRRSCFDAIGGIYISRGWDVMDDVAARLHGWKTRTLDFAFHHNKEEGRRSGIVRKHYYTGLFIGRVPYHPAYLVLKLAKSLFKYPPVLGAFSQVLGYIAARFIHRRSPFPIEVSRHLRREQLARIKSFVSR